MKKKHYFLIFFLTIVTCSFVWVRLELVNVSYAIHQLEREEKTLRDEMSSLTVKINQAKSPQKLDSLARNQFGMRPPAPTQTIILRSK